MLDRVIKRDGRLVRFDESNIVLAINNAMIEANDTDNEKLREITEIVIEELTDDFGESNFFPTVEQIQDVVEKSIQKVDEQLYFYFHNYRETRTRRRVKNTELMKKVEKIGKVTDRDNANVGNNSSAKMLQIGSLSNQASNLLNMPESISRAHEEGDIHIHDLDFYNLTLNCLNIDTGNILKNGFNTGYGFIKPPKRMEVAAELSCILLQSSQNDCFGGQNHYNFDNDMAMFAEGTRKEIESEITEIPVEGLFLDKFDELVQKRLNKRIHQSMQTVVYNLNSMHSRAGSQVPFSGINIGIPETPEAAYVCQALLEEYDKGLGKGENAIFPNIAFRLKKGVNANPEDPYYYLTKLACKVAANRMNPTFINCDASMNLSMYEKGLLPTRMGCRTNVMSNVNGQEGGNRRGNIAPVSINLPRLAIRANGNINKFESLLKETLELCEKQLIHRFGVLSNLKGSDLPFIAGQKLILGSENVGPNDSIEPILRNGTYGIGFIGIAETLTSLLGVHHGQSEHAQQIGIKIVKTIRDFCDDLTKKYMLNFTCYGTPAEGLSGRFVKMDQKKYGIIPGVTDKDYYTNSFHIPVGFNISFVDKAKLESPYHYLCNAGHISYFEYDRSPVDTPESLERKIQYIINCTDIGYFGFNFGIRYCRDCGHNHIQGKICPKCKSSNLQGIFRVTGYLSLEERFPPGKVAERNDRIPTGE